MPRRILIADDEASIRRAVRAFIESLSLAKMTTDFEINSLRRGL